MTDLFRNGFAFTADLGRTEVIDRLREMETFQGDFLAKVSKTWSRKLKYGSDSLMGWSRQWEYPYHFANLDVGRGSLLDAGSGVGFFPFYLSAKGFTVTCADREPLTQPFSVINEAIGETVSFVKTSAASMPFSDHSFDYVCCVSVLEHVPLTQRESVIREFARVLKPGGRLTLTCDISLSGDSDIAWEDFTVMLSVCKKYFQPAYPIDLLRPAGMLTTEPFRQDESWRLPWTKRPTNIWTTITGKAGRASFHVLGVFGLTFVRP